ncbi:hypothetical protein ACFXAZ_12125 [Streptomyces sp. NPDC059477]|uniref:hypothetical protein n=1 Tax=Streptomyces sp. NPDC059477 TaxID=3346847 RepID=UPI0036CA537E
MSYIWKSPQGAYYRIGWGTEHRPVLQLQRMKQDQDTAQWSTDKTHTEPEEIDATVFRETYVDVPPEPLRDPRITRLTALVTELLAEHEASTGAPAANADLIRQTLEAVAEIPAEANRRRHSAVLNARRAGAHSASRR